MSRWYSKQRKDRYSGDMRKYGAIPSYGKILLSDPLSCLDRCDFDDECEFCKSPRKGSYAQMAGCWEYPDEVDYYICGHCAQKRSYKHNLYLSLQYTYFSKFNQWKRKSKLTDGQFICEYCDKVAEGECKCNGFQWNKDNTNT
ncbi:conserved hypothetical protein [Vibrio chagasii]|nr:conserved hypothetical protein [Vibrio chagasii]